MNVLFITQYGPLAASSRTRVFQYLPYLKQAGIEADVRVVISDRWSARIGHRGAASRLLYYVVSFLRTVWVGLGCVLRAGSFDRVLVQKVLFPAPIAWLLRSYRSRMLFDFDDAVFTSDAPDSLSGRVRGRRRQAGLPRMLRASSVAIVENAYTRSYAEPFCDRVEVITGPIDTARYAPIEARNTQVVLGWVGSPTTTVYLDLIREALDRVAEMRPDVTLRLIGALPFESSRIRVEQHDWALDSEVELLATCDIGLMPLPDDPWTRGKGGYKLLQYGAVGLPVVASPVGVNSEIVDHGHTGFLADSDAAWVDHLVKLIDDPALRSRMGQAGRERVLARYSLEESSRRLIEILKQSTC